MTHKVVFAYLLCTASGTLRLVHRPLAVFAACCALVAIARAQSAGSPVQAAPPSVPDPKAHYLFYLHGAIIEEAGRRAQHPRFGVYEYDAVLQALQAGGAIVISELRASGTNIDSYAQKICAQVSKLIEHGVVASHIAIVGFSKGGFIAQRVSAQLNHPELRYVLLGACPGSAQATPRMHGRVLAITERSDSVPSCRRLFARSQLDCAREIQIAIGGEHGAFYRPNPAWMQPVLDFVR